LYIARLTWTAEDPSMKCPHCHTTELLPTMIEETLPAMACGTCHGAMVSLLYYRHWAEQHKAPPVEPPKTVPPVVTTDTTGAVTCPKCERVMMKYKISGAVTNRVDVCSTCDDAWLDGGEWELLEALHLSHEIPAILTDAWQRRIRRELTAETRRSILVRLVGEDGTQRVEQFGEWLDGSGHKSHVLTYLYKNQQ
jgi:Zn-finger nucleic acid-binding protein